MQGQHVGSLKLHNSENGNYTFEMHKFNLLRGYRIPGDCVFPCYYSGDSS